MQDAFTYVVFGVVAVGVVGAVVAAIASRGAYDEIGRDGLYRGDDGADAGADVAARDEEIRQMLAARNARRAAAGRPTVDVEAELARLTAPVVDDRLRAEVRDHVLARNARRMRRGRPPLDVDAEVERQLRELGG
jgi:hypothetical protein